MKTTTHIRSALEHQIMEWAINAELFEDVASREVPGWNSWDRAGILTSERLVIDWETPHMAYYSKLILQRLRGLQEGHARDIYAQVAEDLEERFRRATEQFAGTLPATRSQADAADG